MNALVWFRNDLRVHDHKALYEAASNHDSVIGVYVIDNLNAKTAHGFFKHSEHKRQFLKESLKDLKERLETLNIPLIVKQGSVSEVLNTLGQRYNVDYVYYHREIGDEETAREKDLLNRTNLHVKSFFQKTLLHPDDLPYSTQNIPDIFTHFRKDVERNWKVRKPLPVPSRLSKRIQIQREDCEGLNVIKNGPSLKPYRGGETQGLNRLKYYLFDSDAIATYKETRNGMLRHDDSSKLSPYLAYGCISPRTVYENIKTYEATHVKNQSTYWLVFELLWRDFFSFIHSKVGNHLFRVGGIQNVDIPWRNNETDIVKWIEGRTGYPLVDAAMRELKQTGYMSNRARQNVASFLTKNLGIDWRVGAEWFESQLIDHDVSSNYGNWNYIAGIGNDAREFRFFNVTKQGKRYDPNGEYVKTWVNEIKDVDESLIYDLPTLNPMFKQSLVTDYPEPMVDFENSTAKWKTIYLKAYKKLNHS